MADEVTRDFGSAPEDLIRLTHNELYAIPLAEQHRIQLDGVRKRFGEQIERLPVLKRLAEEQGLHEICSLEDVAPLLIPHSAMKSYPMSFLEKNQFVRLTQWLNGFTTHDLSSIDASACESIDDWLQLLDAQSEVRVMHSTGTSGKLSFLPRGTTEMMLMVPGYTRHFDRFGDDPWAPGVAPEETPILFFQHRKGAMAQHRQLDYLETHLFGGDSDMIVALYPTRFSADAASVGGRLRVAEARGELGKIQISPKLLERREAFLAEQASATEYVDHFLTSVAERFAGRTVYVMSHIPMLHTVAVEARRRGIRNLLDPRSFVIAGGGMKGQSLPDDWLETIQEFLGGVHVAPSYGMTETVAGTRMCPSRHYHLQTWQIPFLLHPVSGAPLPRVGTQTGRFGIVDLNAQTYWGGFLTGDEVTLSWGDIEPCACGRIGPYLHEGIRRYSEKEGGDDKVTCAGAPEAHDRAIEHLLRAVA